MMREQLQQELDKKKFFMVKYAIFIILATIGIVFFLLSILKIDGQSILKSFIMYYFKNLHI